LVLSNNHKKSKTKAKNKTKKQKQEKKTRKRFCNLYLSDLGTKLIDDKREEEKVNVYVI
jgi:hypothetical protein